ncbi:Pectinesterase-2 [Zea mays]|uniref:Pectinesterase n=1 Tax=Zea mays TaxID=4577 RepID=A0A1D6H4M1_MAIZE|nr:Pectinesterase-2 [Zea mays]
MDHLLDRRLGAPLVVIFSCLALILAGCSSALAAPRPVFAFPAVAAKAQAMARHERLRVALDAAATRVGKALGALAAATPASSSPLAAAAREDCAELLDEALQLLAGAGAPGAARRDALTWLSAALTNHDTCADSLAEAGAPLHAHLAAARGVVRDSLAMYASTAAEAATATTTTGAGGAGGLVMGEERSGKNETKRRGPCGFPRRQPVRDRRLLLAPAAALAASADIVVAKDGTGTHATIADAVKAAPECSERRTVIHVKEGRYDENVKVGMKKTNLLFVGDGKGVTVVAGNRSVADNYTTFRTATFEGLSPAAAPAPVPDRSPLLLSPTTYLGRPWKSFSRVVVMMSYIGPHVPPQGWMEWNATSTYALDRLYFGEYMNYGPGAGLAGRVAWPGHRVINSTAEAESFTVARFIDGASWLPAAGVSFVAGLSLL